MKKSLLIGCGIGVLFSILIVLVYMLTVNRHNSNVPVETVVVERTTEAAIETESESVTETEPATETAPVETTPVETDPEEKKVAISYEDLGSADIPLSAFDSYSAFVGCAEVQQMLGDLLFDTVVEWESSTYQNDSGEVSMRGRCTNATGTVTIHVNIRGGVAELERHIQPSVAQTKDDFPNINSNHIITLAKGKAMTEVPSYAMYVYEFTPALCSDYDSFYSVDYEGVSQTIDIVLSEYSNPEQKKFDMVYYLRKQYGSGPIEVWDYYKHEGDVVTFYVSTNGYNVALRIKGGDPNVLYVASQPSRTGDLFGY